tara:strand:+ start:1633 stop:3501 length:1869 start_codon:yes stop_codon:yes gene_type:complete
LIKSSKTPFRLIIAGHVDHGKSTLVGRLLHDTGALSEGKIQAVKMMSERRGMPLEYAFLLDSLQAERDQGITIDTTQIVFNSAKRSYVIIDAPGHKEFLKNMISGAAQADGGIVVVDAVEGLQEQSRRHCYLLQLLGLTQVSIVINKMDLVEYDEQIFSDISIAASNYLREIGIKARNIIPVSARSGIGLLRRSKKMSWYKGPSFLKAIDGLTPLETPNDKPLRLPIQDVYKFDNRRILVGKIETGSLKIGDILHFSPSNKTAAVSTFEHWGEQTKKDQESAGKSVAFTLREQIFVERGHIASLQETPPIETNVFRARVFWISQKPLRTADRLTIKIATAEYSVEVQSIEGSIDTDTLRLTPTDEISRHEIGEITIRARATVVLDAFDDNPKTGRFVLIDGFDTVGGGIVSMDGYANQRGRYDVISQNIVPVDSKIDRTARAKANDHKSGIIWLTGLSGAGKSTIAVEVEKQLFRKGYQVYVLDGDNIRFGLSADLGFSPEDRTENIRRIGEVAKLFAEAGILVITAFISPYRDDRARVRTIAPEMFHEVFIKADLSICENRDPKGLYAKARNGEILEFTGISAPYEEPTTAELIIDTEQQSVDQSVAALIEYVSNNFTPHH